MGCDDQNPYSATNRAIELARYYKQCLSRGKMEVPLLFVEQVKESSRHLNAMLEYAPVSKRTEMAIKKLDMWINRLDAYHKDQVSK